MIAPLGRTDTETAAVRRRLQRAHQLIACTFLKHGLEPAEHAPPISAWRAWLFTAWVVIVTGVYFATMLGWL